MKKIFTLLALCLTTVFAAQAGTKQIYASWTEATQTMTLYYDDQKEARDGTTEWWYNSVLQTAKTVVLDESMKYARPTSTASWFRSFNQLTNIQRLDYLNTSEVTSMYAMFQDCRKLSDIDLRLFDTQKVTNMSFMFESCWSLTSLNVNNFNIYKVEDMQAMFHNCSSLTTIYCNNSWDGISAESANMFYNCKVLKGGNGTKCDGQNNIDATYARPDGVNSKKGYFTWTEEIYAVWDASTTTLTIYYDKNRIANGGTTSWDPYYKDEYKNATKIVFDQSMQKARPVSTRTWFAGYNNITKIQNLTYLNTTEVRDMFNMFGACEKLQTLDLSSFYTAKVENMAYLFASCKALQSITFGNTFYTSNVESMQGMFEECESLTSLDLSKFVTTRVQSMTSMFSGCKALKSLNLGTYFTAAKVTNMAYMFSGCEALTSLNLSKFNTSNVTNMREMFRLCKALESLDLSSFNTENVTNMNAMFSTCSNLKNVNLSSFNTENVTDMKQMFYGCQSLTSLDLSKFNVTNLQYCSQMFMNCRALTTIFCNDDWSKNSRLTNNSTQMFAFCTKLKGGNGTPFNSSYVDVTYARPDMDGQQGYFTSDATGIEDIHTSATSGYKILRDGQVLILRGDRTYTLSGQEVK